ncbi:4-coumarate--CoA ligase-like 5-like [Heracleum sosnowskyi]|uniref:4-coumarate--CoA ligase-like 5-like n=1 Tax=Heracleum sosnowskyi TaxID=360622 RepID=A0AAD8MYS7_9APIA|nr:4-coumarate--CoA ligase-like 5-like [Heracleum sosnowskyi]
MEFRPNFAALKKLQDSANDLLHSPTIRRSLVQEKYVDEVCEASLQMLDICDTTKALLLHVKDHLQELQSTFRTISVGETSIENKLGAYYIHRKNLKREMMNFLRSLKEMKLDLYPIDNNLAMVVNVLRQVRVTTISTVESLMSLMSMPSPDSYKSYISSFTSKFIRVNSLSLWENCDTTAFQTGNKRLEAVEIEIEDLQVELECIFRRLIETRVSLLNILTN